MSLTMRRTTINDAVLLAFTQKQSTTTGLTLGYYGGVAFDGAHVTVVADGTVALTASSTNYVEVNPVSGAVSANTTGWTSGLMPMMTVVTGGAAISAGGVTDRRPALTTAGSLTTATRVVTAAGAVTVTSSDTIVVVNKTSGAATTVNLPAGETYGIGKLLIIKDGKGDAETNNITIDGNGAETIDGATTKILNNNYGAVILFWNGTEWNSVASAAEGGGGSKIVSGAVDGKPEPSQKVLMFVADQAYSFATNLAGSQVKVETNPTASWVATVYKNGVSQGTITVATSGTVTIATSAFSLAAGDKLTAVAPSVQDATLADFFATLVAT